MNTTELFLELTNLMQQHLKEEYPSNYSLYSDVDQSIFFERSSKKSIFQRSIGQPPQPPVKSFPLKEVPLVVKTEVVPSKEEIVLKKEVKVKPKLEIHALEKKSEKKMGMMKKRLNQEVPLPIQEVNFFEIKSLVQEKCPSLKFKERLPDDKEAKIQESLWKQALIYPECVIFSYQDSPKARKFLQNIEIALKSFLRVKVVDAKRLESEGGWDKLFSSKDLKYVISCQATLDSLTVLKGFSTELEGKIYLGEVPLLLLEDPSIYFQDPMKKKLLWESFYSRLN